MRDRERERERERAGSWLALASAILIALGPAVAFAQPAPPSKAQAPPVVVPPRPVTPLTAGYPKGTFGDAVVMLVIIVNADGSVRSAKPARGAPEPFASAAVAASSGWTFSPATSDGKPIASKIRAEIRFTAPPPVPVPVPGAPNAAKAPNPPPPPPPKALEVDVRGEIPPPGATSLSRAEVRLLPGAFGDPFRAVEMLPGVTPLASGVPFFYVRGAPPGNVGYYLDGIRVPLLYHIGLGPSVIHPAIVDRVDLHPGGYPARFGRYAGGIVSGETHELDGAWHGEASLRIVDSGAMLTGPLGDKGSFFVSGRVSYTGLLLSAISSSLDLGYWDYGARATIHLTPKADLTLFAFGARDYLGDTNDGETRTLFNTTFHRIDLRYDQRLEGPDDRVRQAITIGVDRTGFDKESGVSDRMIAARTEIQKRVADRVLLRAGLDGQVDSYTADLGAAFPGAGGFTSLFSGRMDLAMGARADAVIDVTKRLQITPGLRVDFFTSRGQTAIGVDPRLSARLAITPQVRLVQAHGLASQTPSFILPGPGFQPALSGGLQRSFQTSVGVECDLPWDVSASATFFRNAFFDLSDALGTSAVPEDGGSFPVRFDRRAIGSSIGLELTVRRRLTKRLGGFVSYTLSRSERSIGGSSRVASSFDRTHVLNVALTQDFGKGYKTGARLVFYSGFPISTLAPTFLYQIVQTGRIRPFFRFDWRAEKRWRVGRGWLSLVLEMQNSMLAKETLQEQCGRAGCEPVRIGPVTIPSIGLEGGF